MIARLLLVLLLAGLALPATAAMPCHDAAPPPMAGMTHHAPAISDAPTAPAKAMPAHLCIGCVPPSSRSEEHTSELQSLMRISYAVFCLKKKKNKLITSKIITCDRQD